MCASRNVCVRVCECSHVCVWSVGVGVCLYECVFEHAKCVCFELFIFTYKCVGSASLPTSLPPPSLSV